MRRNLLLAALITFGPAASIVSAQSEDRIAIDSAIGISHFFDQATPPDGPDIIIDVTAAVRLGAGWVAYVRPWFRQPSSSAQPFAKTIYQAALQYERSGRISTRVDLGYILSPIGLGMLDMRPDTNPLVMPHLAYLVPMPGFETGVPGSLPIASSYPLGGQVTASTRKWDARAAVMASPPNRNYVLGAANPNPPVSPTLIVGGGVTPRTGLRFGLGYATGNYATASEVTAATAGSRGLRMLSAEAEFAFGFTKVSGELTHDYLEMGTGEATATQWFVQGVQTLAPRWFAAVRHEGVDAPPRAPGGDRPTLRTSEASVGYRLTNEFTIRGSFASRKTYFSLDPDRQVGLQLVWARRWR